jgi:hypothetical protein
MRRRFSGSWSSRFGPGAIKLHKPIVMKAGELMV